MPKIMYVNPHTPTEVPRHFAGGARIVYCSGRTWDGVLEQISGLGTTAEFLPENPAWITIDAPEMDVALSWT